MNRTSPTLIVTCLAAAFIRGIECASIQKDFLTLADSKVRTIFLARG
jgi:hypothetical protein